MYKANFMMKKSTEFFLADSVEDSYSITYEQIFTIDIHSYVVQQQSTGREIDKLRVEQEIAVEIIADCPFFITIQTILKDTRDDFDGKELIDKRLYINVDDGMKFSSVHLIYDSSLVN